MYRMLIQFAILATACIILVSCHKNYISVKTSEELNALIKNVENKDKYVVIEYSTSWCSSCKTAKKKFVELTRAYSSRPDIKFVLAEDDEVAIESGIENVPTFRIYKNGEKIREFLGHKFKNIRDTLDKAE